MAGHNIRCVGLDRQRRHCELIAQGREDIRRMVVKLSTDGVGPSALGQVANFAKAAFSHVSHGMPTVSDEEKERRLAICGACPLYEDGKCKKCGCPMARKASWTQEKCPEGKW